MRSVLDIPVRSRSRKNWHEAGRWTACSILSICLTAAVVIHGGVDPTAWQWIALVIAVASAVCIVLRPRRILTSALTLEDLLLCALAAWMLAAMIPLPPALVQFLSPHRADAALAARALTGNDHAAWFPVSSAPAATFERLLFVLPAMAVFVAAREMPGWWPRGRAWIAVAPVIAVAAIEGALGATQTHGDLDGSPGFRVVSGTYVNRNHYAGLLALALPLALAWAAELWARAARRERTRPEPGWPPIDALLGVATLLLAAGAILAGVILSQSRMGLVAASTGLATMAFGGLWLHSRRHRISGWLWLMPILVVLGIVAFLSADATVLRFGEALGGGIEDEGRLTLWRESWRLFRAYPLTGTGLGTYAHALSPFRSWMPMNAVEFAHNDYLQILDELGVIGFALAMTLAGCIVRRSVVWLRAESRSPWLGLGLLAAFAAAGLHSTVEFNLYIPANALALAWLAGVAASPGSLETHV
jgi:O-antigen ligase